MDKRAQIEERKKKWMANRDISNIQSEAQYEVQNERRALHEDSKQSGSHKSSSEFSHQDNDAYLNKLTERLTVHIRNEIQKELSSSISSSDVRDSVSSKMDSYLSAELSTHTCKICFELMTSPDHTPVLLFPCGHTFCKQCIDQVTRTHKGCPYCRAPIQSKAVNQSLKDLIDQFAKQKSMIESGPGVHLDQVFSHTGSSPGRKGSAPSSSSRGGGSGSSAGSGAAGSGQQQQHYQAQLRSCEMRYTILYNEYMEAAVEVEAIRKKRAKLRTASDHLMEERNKLDAKIALLQEERQLIDEHLSNQAAKTRDVDQVERDVAARAQMLKNSMTNLETDMDKLNILMKGAS